MRFVFDEGIESGCSNAIIKIAKVVCRVLWNIIVYFYQELAADIIIIVSI
jgi:hypothetical protein